MIKGKGAMDRPDPRDYKAEHVLGGDVSDLPESIDLLNITAKDQKRTMHCTAYSCTHAMEMMNTREFLSSLNIGEQIELDAEQQWKNQLEYPGDATEEHGDFIQSAPKALKKFGLWSEKLQKNLYISGYAAIDKTEYSFKKWLSLFYPLLTGCNTSNKSWSDAKKTGKLIIDNNGGGHAFCIYGYSKEGIMGSINSWGSKWGFFGNGTFIIPWDQISNLFTTYIMHDEIEAKELFKDLNSNSWAYDDVKLCIKEWIIKGYDDGTFRPDQPITRAEVATIAARLLRKING